jgi:large repetitive protein
MALAPVTHLASQAVDIRRILHVGTIGPFSHGDVLGQFAPAGTAMAGSQTYHPWGNVTATTGSLSGLLGFQSAWTDPGTGKDLMGARWYSPVGRDFTSADTVQVPAVPDPAAASPFGYAADNPLGNTDPTGHMISIGSPETNTDYLAETTYANVYAGTVQRAGPAAATAAYTSTEKLVKKIVNPKPAKPAPRQASGARFPRWRGAVQQRRVPVRRRPVHPRPARHGT